MCSSVIGNVTAQYRTELYFYHAVFFKGTFSRYDYQRSQTFAVIKSFKSVLPASAADVYYRDEIGNISTSNLLAMDDSVELEIRPRFPLFGGWQTRYYTGYNVPSYEYLFNTGSFNYCTVLYLSTVTTVLYSTCDAS